MKKDRTDQMLAMLTLVGDFVAESEGERGGLISVSTEVPGAYDELREVWAAQGYAERDLPYVVAKFHWLDMESWEGVRLATLAGYGRVGLPLDEDERVCVIEAHGGTHDTWYLFDGQRRALHIYIDMAGK